MMGRELEGSMDNTFLFYAKINETWEWILFHGREGLSVGWQIAWVSLFSHLDIWVLSLAVVCV